MHQELTISVGQGSHKVFLQPGFYRVDTVTHAVHRHRYAELHVIGRGGADFSVGEQTFCLESGEALWIPSGTFHSCMEKTEDLLHTAFQVDREIGEPRVVSVSEGLTDCLFAEIGRCVATGEYTVLSSYLALLLSFFERGEAVRPCRIDDDGFLIGEFFSAHYGEEVQLSDLAQVLHRSERQTERLLLMHTGHTFREELGHVRMRMAEYLMKHTDLSMGEIARYVGYRSYAGFWKARQQVVRKKETGE